MSARVVQGRTGGGARFIHAEDESRLDLEQCDGARQLCRELLVSVAQRAVLVGVSWFEVVERLLREVAARDVAADGELRIDVETMYGGNKFDLRGGTKREQRNQDGIRVGRTW